ncbi:hypothetical protein A3E49_03185 [Candidatus Saccharibacteria bacterium RIFCSPHIGHO2_12_FULL_49_19]|nr:MAG: hypothetical protein A3E49_03185 [Candidatus Saccharibacteria bacterium RIFCSPHIGHO2_12_FULL_49_19]
MVKKLSIHRRGPSFGWAKLAVITLAVLGLVFFSGFMIVHWTQRQLLTTDNWVELVAPLPKNEQVSSAVAVYSVDKLFETINVEQKVGEVLPPQAAFLAPPLSERIKTRTTNLAQDLIQSDQFQSIWITANRTAHQKLMNAARDEAPKEEGSQRTGFQLKLENLLTAVKEKLGSSSAGLFANTGERDPAVSVDVDLKTKFETFKKFVSVTDFLNGTLLLASAACLVGALALSNHRRRLFMAIMAAIAIVSLLQLIGIKALRPAVLNQIENVAYQPATGVVYDELLATFQRGATTVFAVSTLLFVLFFVLGRPIVSKNKSVRKWLKVLRATRFWQAVCSARNLISRNRWPIFGVTSFLVMVFMAFIPDFDWQGLVRALLVILIILGLVNLLSPQRSAAYPR